MEFLDQYGKPLDKSSLNAQQSEQTAEIAQLHQEFANHPSRGLTPSRLASVLAQAEKGDLVAQCDLFADIEEKDGHVVAEMGKRRRALLGLDWSIEPPKNPTAQEQHVADLVTVILDDVVNFEDVILDMADAIGYGYSCLEIEWQKGKHWQPRALHHREPRNFTLGTQKSNVLRLRDMSSEGASLWSGGWVTHIHKAKSGHLGRAGLFRALAWPFLFKNYSVRDLAEFLEIYGLPVRLGQYPRGSTEAEKLTLLRAVTNMGHAAAGIIPDGMLVDFKEAAKGGSDPYVAMMDWCERTQSKCILGGTLTSGADGASSTNALGNVHNEVRHDLLIADARQIESTLSRDLINSLCFFNGWSHDSLRCPRFVFDTVEPEDLALFAEAIPKLVAVGVQVPVAYIHEKLRIPQPEQDEPVLALAQPLPQGEVALKQAVTALAAKPVVDELSTLDVLTEQLAVAGAAPVNNWLAVIEQKVQAADSLEALRDDLLQSYGDLDGETLTEVMSLAFSSAALSGVFDVDEGE